MAEAVTLRIQGVPATVLYAGPAPGLEGSDQINAIIPPELAGLGSVNVRVRANNRDSNTVTIRLGGQVPDARAADITAGQTVNGTLTVDDQVQAGSSGNTFFFDAYKFSTTAANTPIAVDLRSTAFDAAALLYRLDGTQLTLIAADDESGSYGSRPADNNHNAMLMTVIQNPGNYVIFVTSSDFEPNGIGNYSVRLVNATITPLTYGQTVSGTVANTDLQNSVGVYYDMYSFNGTQGDRQSIRLTSTAFDSFLILLRNDGDPYLVADDNGAGGNDALIDPTHGNNGINGQPLSSLPRTGTYIIVATPFEANRTGNYNLTLNRLTGLTGEPEPTNAWNQLFRAPSREIRSLRVVGGDAGRERLDSRADAFIMDGSILAANISKSKNPADFKIVGEVLSVEPIACMLRKDDPAFKKAVDDSIVRQIKDGSLAKLYDRWFMQPIPPANVKVGLPLSAATKEAWEHPNDKPMESYEVK